MIDTSYSTEDLVLEIRARARSSSSPGVSADLAPYVAPAAAASGLPAVLAVSSLERTDATAKSSSLPPQDP